MIILIKTQKDYYLVTMIEIVHEESHNNYEHVEDITIPKTSDTFEPMEERFNSEEVEAEYLTEKNKELYPENQMLKVVPW